MVQGSKIKHQSREGSLYPLHPEGSRLLLRISGADLSLYDRCLVVGSSLFVVGAFAWAPMIYIWAWRRWKSIPVGETRRRATYAGLVFVSIAILSLGPHRTHRMDQWLRVRKWKLWTSWLKFIAMEVIADQKSSFSVKDNEEQAILAFVPHGIFPFAFAFGLLPDIAQEAFGIFRPVVATATNFLPVVSDFLLWLGKVDASKSSVNAALSRGDRIGIVPGGIAEIFEGYPKHGAGPNEEYSIVRKGFLRLAVQHGVPVVPIYCFGATKMFRRLNLPFLDRLSTFMRASVVVFFGVWGLPIPFRQRLMYVIGNPIYADRHREVTNEYDEQHAVDEMHVQFCNELLRIFERHKESYGWGHKSLKVISRKTDILKYC